jgi:hypothetical protein
MALCFNNHSIQQEPLVPRPGSESPGPGRRASGGACEVRSTYRGAPPNTHMVGSVSSCSASLLQRSLKSAPNTRASTHCAGIWWTPLILSRPPRASHYSSGPAPEQPSFSSSAAARFRQEGRCDALRSGCTFPGPSRFKQVQGPPLSASNTPRPE